VLIEPLAGQGFRAHSGEPLPLTVEGSTLDEVLHKLQELVTNRLAAGARLVPLELPSSDNPWLSMAGMYKDDPQFEDWQMAMAEYRRQVEADQEIP
jgi:hypothetical protein